MVNQNKAVENHIEVSEETDLNGEEITVLSLPRGGTRVSVSKLKELYLHQHKSLDEVADQLSTSTTSVIRLMDAAGIPRRKGAEANKRRLDEIRNRDYTDESTLREMYNEKGMSVSEISDEFDVGYGAIKYWLKKNGIETRNNGYRVPQFTMTYSNRMGYPVMKGCDGQAISIHRLVMVANGEDPHDVYGDTSKNVHHRNGFKCDNRPQNLELVDRREHGRKHSSKAHYNQKWTDDDLEAAVKFILNPGQYLLE